MVASDPGLASSQQWPSAKAKDPVTTQREVPGRWRQSRGAAVTSQVPKPRMSPDAAREKAQSSVTKLEKALEAMVDVVGPAVEVLKSELIKARAAAKQPAVDVEIDQCRKFIARSERRIKELDSQRAEESASMTEAQERLKRLLGDVTPADGQQHCRPNAMLWRKSCTRPGRQSRTTSSQ